MGWRCHAMKPARRAVCRRNPAIQKAVDNTANDRPNERFWIALLHRFPGKVANAAHTGTSFGRPFAPLHCFFDEPMCGGRLFLADNAGHSLAVLFRRPAKSLNLANLDVYCLYRAIEETTSHCTRQKRPSMRIRVKSLDCPTQNRPVQSSMMPGTIPNPHSGSNHGGLA